MSKQRTDEQLIAEAQKYLDLAKTYDSPSTTPEQCLEAARAMVKAIPDMARLLGDFIERLERELKP